MVIEQLLVTRKDGARAGSQARRFVLLLAVIWLLAVAGAALALTLHQAHTIAQLLRDDRARRDSLVFAVELMGLAVAGATAAALAVPRRGRQAMLALAILPVPILLVTSHNVVAGGAVLALLGPPLWLGRELVARWLRPVAAGDAWILGGAVGVGLLAILGYGLLRLGILRPYVIWPMWLLLTLLLVALAGRRLRHDALALVRWSRRPLVCPPYLVVLWGALIGYFWLDLIGALAPEMMADAVRQRMPAAQFFAAAGRFAVRPDLPLTRRPSMGEILYALVLAGGPLQTAKLFDLLAGICCAAGVWALGRRLGGARVGTIALLAFYTLPLTTWLSQTAYTDFFAVLFALAAVQLLVLHERLTWRVIAAIAAFVALGLGVKATTAAVAVGLAVAMGVMAAERRRLAVTVAIPGVALLALAVAFARLNPAVLAALPGHAGVAHAAGRLWGVTAMTFSGLGTFGKGHSPAALLRLPWDVTFDTSVYGEYQAGFTGYLLLALTPLAVVTRPRRRVALLLAVGGIAYLAWAFLAQYVRYALPFLGIFCALGAYAYVETTRAMPRALRAAVRALLLLLVGLGTVAYLDTSLIYPGDVPYRVVLGLQTRDAYLHDNVDAYTALRLLDAEPGARLAYAPQEYARLYTRVPIGSILTSGNAVAVTWAGNEAAALQALDANGYTDVIIDRGQMMPYWDQILAVSEEFLRRNAVLVGGDHNAYLYHLVPPAQRGHDQQWARGAELVANGGFEKAKAGLPAGWTPVGHPVYDTTGKQSSSGRGAIRSTPTDTLFTTIPVRPDVQYLLSHATKSADGAYDLARLQINWLDADGKFIAASLEVVPTSPTRYFLRSMLATAPPAARSATVYAQAQQGSVWFDDVSLKSVLPDRAAAGGARAHAPADAGLDTRAPARRAGGIGGPTPMAFRRAVRYHPTDRGRGRGVGRAWAAIRPGSGRGDSG